MKSIVSLDIETTGLDPKNDAIIEIGAVKFNDRRVEDEWNTFIHPGRRIPPFITRLTGITDQMVLQAPPINDVLAELNDFIQDLTVDIVLRSHPDNQAAVDKKGNIVIDKLDNMDELYSVRVVIFGDEGIPGKGDELAEMLDGYRESLSQNADPELTGMINKLLDTSPRGELTWIQYCFLQAPMIGAVNVLTNIQSNIRVAEGEVLNQLLHRPLELAEE